MPRGLRGEGRFHENGQLGLGRKVMRRFCIAVASVILLASAGLVRADDIHLQYTTFGGNTPTTEGPLTPAMGTAVANSNSAILTSNNAEVGAVTMDSGASTTANQVSLSFGLKVLSQT